MSYLITNIVLVLVSTWGILIISRISGRTSIGSIQVMLIITLVIGNFAAFMCGSHIYQGKPLEESGLPVDTFYSVVGILTNENGRIVVIKDASKQVRIIQVDRPEVPTSDMVVTRRLGGKVIILPVNTMN